MRHTRTRARAVKAGILAAVVAAMVALVGFASRPASADLLNDRQKWLREAQAGLFLHWGMRTSPTFGSCTTWENAVNNTSQTGGRWEASKWVNAAKQLHTKYIVLAVFHSRLGYARAWPSKIPGSCATKRDFLRELLNAAHAADLKVINYMTDDPSHHNENGPEYLNSAAYSAFKGRTIDITTRDGFGEFSYDNFIELLDKYPDLDGFWIDNDNAVWERRGLYAHIHSLRPHMLLSNNNEDTPEMDTVSHEQKTGMTPSYDMPQAIWTPAPRLTEPDYKLPTSGNWWFSGGDSSVDRKLTIGRFLANAGSSMKSLMAETAMVNGDFPSQQRSFNSFFNSWVSPIWSALDKTQGGGYMYGGLKGGSFGNGAYGFTTVKQVDGDLLKVDPSEQYIHVVDPPTNGTVRVRDNGYVVSSVTNLRTGAAVNFSQGSGFLTLTGLSGFDPFDTVFRVTTTGRVGIYPVGSVTATASASRSGFPASNLVDGSYLRYWDNNNSVPVTITLDLGSVKKVAYLAINQREWSPTHNRTTFGRAEDSARIRNYTLQTSNDGSSFTTVRTADMPSTRGVSFIDFAANTRFIRLRVNSTWASSDVPNFFHKLGIDEMFVGSDFARGGIIQPPPPNRFEAENATVSAGSTIDSNHLGFSGTGFVNTPNAAGAFVEWTGVNATAGTLTLTFRFSNGSTAARPCDLVVNGGTPMSVNFGTTANWDTWSTVSVSVPLNATNNTIRLTATTAGGAANLDWLEVS